MKFTIGAEQFEAVVSKVLGVTEKKQTMPIVGNLLLKVGGNTLLVMGTNTEIEAGARAIAESVDEAGEVCVDASKLSAFLRSFDGDKKVTIQTDGEQALLKCGRSRFKLGTLPTSSFPNIDLKNEKWVVQGIEVEADQLLTQLGRVSHAMASNDTRAFLNGVLVEIDGKELRLVATDGHRLAKSILAIESEAKAACILPRKMVQEMTRCFARSGKVSLSISDNHFEVRSNSERLTSHVIAGKYPDYERVIPKNTSKTVTTDCSDLAKAMKRSLITSQDVTKGIQLKFDTGLVIESHNQTNETCIEELEVDWGHGAFEVGFNGAYLHEALSSIKGGDCLIGFEDTKGAAVLSALGSTDNYLVVLMPCRV